MTRLIRKIKLKLKIWFMGRQIRKKRIVIKRIAGEKTNKGNLVYLDSDGKVRKIKEV